MNLLPRPRHADLSAQLAPLAEPSLVTDRSLPREGYRLGITDGGVVIESSTDAGAFYARATLDQLARVHDGQLPTGVIEDWPALDVRGVMLDISRDKVPTIATLEALIDRLASWKINQVQLYTEHTFAYRDHREVWQEASPLDAEEIRGLDAFCRARHVELVPNQNCLGHWDRWLRHGRYRSLAIAPDGWDERGRHREPTTIDPTKPESLALVRTLLAELLPNFTSQRVHVGLDEPWELPKARIADYLDWVRALRAIPELAEREMLMWGDILEARPDLLAQLPDRALTICEWWYDAQYPWEARGSTYEETGRAWWACPGTSSWQTILGRWSNFTANIAEAIDAAGRHGAGGVLTTDWGDRGHLQYLPISEPGFAWTAALGWCGETNGDLDLPAALDAHAFDDRNGVIGSALRDLGETYLTIVPQFPNMSTLVLHLYFPQMQLGRTFTEGIDVSQLDAAEAMLTDVDARLDKAKIGRADGALVIAELRTAIAMVQLLCRDARARLDADGWLTSVPEGVRHHLADELAPLIAQHREHWLARNRPGGLDDSAAWLVHLERCYRTGTTEKYWGGW